MADNLDHGGPPHRSRAKVNEAQAIGWSNGPNDGSAATEGPF